jgi:hypothetical protein
LYRQSLERARRDVTAHVHRLGISSEAELVKRLADSPS